MGRPEDARPARWVQGDAVSLAMLVVCTDFSTRFVPEEIALAAGATARGRQHWRVMKRLMQWAEWMDRCEGMR